MRATPLTISAADGYPLGAHLWQPSSCPPKGIVVINAGTCIAQGFYAKIAQYLSDEGFAVLSYDYRGVGASRPAQLHKANIRITDWAQHDMVGVFAWVNHSFPELPKYLLAHSMGGQIIGLAHNITVFDKITTVASSYGNPRYYVPAFRRRMQRSLWLLPWVERWYGYVPARLIGGSEDWARGVSRQWRTWARADTNFAELIQREGYQTYFTEIKQGFRAYFVADDVMATPATIPFYQRDFEAAAPEIVQLDERHGRQIGHFGFFTGRTHIEIWQDMCAWWQA